MALADSSYKNERYERFVKLLALHDQGIRRFVRSLLPFRDGVDDVVQDTALECWKKFSDFEDGGAEKHPHEFIRWACVIARYKVLSWQRDKSRDRLIFRESVIVQLADTSLDRIDKSERERQAVENCLAEFDQDQRRLILSVHMPGDSVARVASESGQEVRRLYSRVNALRKVLMNCVKQRIVEER